MHSRCNQVSIGLFPPWHPNKSVDYAISGCAELARCFVSDLAK